MQKQKVIIVDDHKVFRKGLQIIVDDCDIAEVVAEASSGEEFLEIINNIEVDIVFMDINMSELDGFETTKRALKIKKNLKIIAMSANNDLASIKEMLSSGAKGYLVKDVDYDEIHSAIKSLADNRSYFSENIFIKLTQNISDRTTKLKAKKEQSNLTKREYEILELICTGLSNFEISEKLFISERTVEKHKANLFVKTDTENSLKLALYAFRNDIVSI